MEIREKINYWIENLCGSLLLFAVGISLMEIVLRIFFAISFDLFFSFTVWTSVWSLLLITGFVLKQDGHVAIDLLRHHLSGRGRWFLEIGIKAINLAYGFFFLASSLMYTYQLYRRQAVFPNYFPIPQWLVVLCVPLSMALFSIFALREFMREIQKGSAQY